jgi:hypothetical protein
VPVSGSENAETHPDGAGAVVLAGKTVSTL